MSLKLVKIKMNVSLGTTSDQSTDCALCSCDRRDAHLRKGNYYYALDAGDYWLVAKETGWAFSLPVPKAPAVIPSPTALAVEVTE